MAVVTGPTWVLCSKLCYRFKKGGNAMAHWSFPYFAVVAKGVNAKAHWSLPYFAVLAVELVAVGIGFWVLLRHARGGG
jgi:hypothetical protein